MPCSLSACLIALVLVSAAASPSPARPPDSALQPASVDDDSNWIASRFYPLGTDHEVFSCIVHDGDLVVSGNFAGVGDGLAPGVARWDGTGWWGYPGTDLTGGVLTEVDGTLTLVKAWGILPDLSYTLVQVLSWNGTGWDESPWLPQFAGTRVQTFVDRRVGDVAVWNGDVLVTPVFPGTPWFEGGARIARWDGTTWSAFHEGGTNEYLALEVWNGALYASGRDISTYDRFIDRWDGATWTREWTGPTYVPDFAVHDGELYAAHWTGGVLRRDGAAWIPYADPVTATKVASTSYGLTVATGTSVEAWTGSLWNVLGTLGGPANELAMYGGDPVAAGNQDGHISLFDGIDWNPPGQTDGQGLTGDVEVLTSHAGRLFVAGDISVPALGNATVAAWDGVNWEVVRPKASAGALAMTEYGEGLVVGESNGHIVEWDGSVWSTLGGANGTAQTLAVYDGTLIAGGAFTSIGGVPADRVASWDGDDWKDMGGVSGPPGVTVNAFTVWNDLLIVAGNFTTAGGRAIAHIASWNGHQWRDLEPSGKNPPVVTGPVKAVAVYNGGLVASGSFWGTDVIASWDGDDWSPLDGGLNTAPDALCAYGEYLLAAGENLSEAGGIPVNRIAAWDGTVWDALGSGLERPRPAFESPGWAFAEHQGILYVGGNFRTAGGKPSNRVAMWTGPSTVAAPPDRPAALRFAVQPGVPNPCRATTRITFRMPRASHVTADVFDAAGRNLGRIVDREFPAGTSTISWSPRTMRSASGSALPAGAYFIRVSALRQSRAQKVVYIP